MEQRSQKQATAAPPRLEGKTQMGGSPPASRCTAQLGGCSYPSCRCHLPLRMDDRHAESHYGASRRATGVCVRISSAAAKGNEESRHVRLGLVSKDCGQLGCRKWFANQESLYFVATKRAEHGSLLFSVHAFRCHSEVQFLPQADDRAHEGHYA